MPKVVAERKRMTGKGKWSDQKKGYVFILGENHLDYFIQWSGIGLSHNRDGTRAQAYLKENENVSFEIKGKGREGKGDKC